jgi:hypothetical protein
MRGRDELTHAGPRWRRRQATVVVMTMAVAFMGAGCAAGTPSDHALAVPARSDVPAPDYTELCAPVGADTSGTCLRLTLEAIDDARAHEGVRPMLLPSDFASLTVPEQLFVAIDRERVDRGLTPFAGLSDVLDAGAQRAADSARLPSRPGRGFSSVETEWIGAVDNGLDADFQWMYADGPDSGVPACGGGQASGCWADRNIVLTRFGVPGRELAMGAAFDPQGDTDPGDRGGSSLAATLALEAPGAATSGAFAYTWKDVLAATSTGALVPLRGIPSSESDSGIPDPAGNVAPVPDFTRVCGSGLDDSSPCLEAALAAINHAHALEGVRPMLLPTGFAQMSVPEQLFVVVNLERLDRGLPPFAGLTAALDQNAERGADAANDPPDPGRGYYLDDAEWAGGSSNGLDADYGWMYDDGYASGNLDCEHRGAAGCWGHRKGILDDFGSGSNLVMGAAVDARGDTHHGDSRGTSMAVTLAVANAPVRTYSFSWSEVLAMLPPGAAPAGS